MDRCALFVDAGYVLADGAMAVHGTRRRDSVSWDHSGLLRLLTGLARDRTGLPVLRSYWYEAAADGNRTAEHDSLAELAGLKLRLVNVRPGRREGIETQLRRDLLTLANNGAICDAFVASANENLAEIVADVQDLGLRVVILHISADSGWTVPASLRQECDDLVEISGVHLRPFVDLIRGAEPATADEFGVGAVYAVPAANDIRSAAQSYGDASMVQAGHQAGFSGGNGIAQPGRQLAQSGQPGLLDGAAPGGSLIGGPAQHGFAAAAAAAQSGPPQAGYPNGAALPGMPSDGYLDGIRQVGAAALPDADRHSIGQHATAQLGVGQHGAGQHGIGQHGAGQHGAGQHGIGQHGIGQHSIGQHAAQQGAAAVQPPGQHVAGLGGSPHAQQLGAPVPGGPLAIGGAPGTPGPAVPAPAGPAVAVPGGGSTMGAAGGVVPAASVQLTGDPASNPAVPGGQALGGGQHQAAPGSVPGGPPQGGYPGGAASAAPVPGGAIQGGAIQGRAAGQHALPPGGYPAGQIQNGSYQNGLGQGQISAVPPAGSQGGYAGAAQQASYPNGWPQLGGQQDGYQQGAAHNGGPAAEPYGSYGAGAAAAHAGFAAAPTPGQHQPYGPPEPGQFTDHGQPAADQAQRAMFGPIQPHASGTGFPAPVPYAGPAQQPAPPPAQVPAIRPIQPVAISLPDAVKAAHAEGFGFGESVGRDAPALWLDAVLARKPRMPSDLEARLLQGSALPIDSLLHDEVRHSLRRGFWDALESARR